MATERLPMRKTREILRQKWVLHLTHREVTASLGVSIGAVSCAVHRLSWQGRWLRKSGLGRCRRVVVITMSIT